MTYAIRCPECRARYGMQFVGDEQATLARIRTLASHHMAEKQHPAVLIVEIRPVVRLHRDPDGALVEEAYSAGLSSPTVWGSAALL